ncbi:MAG: pyridoxamine 5'-phosphate oxidase family protein [Terracidiphilus sp.]
MKHQPKQLELVSKLLHEETTLSLATTGEDGEASVAPLFYIAGYDLSLYWLSSESSLHSLNLKKSSRASATVYRNALSWKEIRGVQMRGLAEKVTQPKRRSELIEAYCERFRLGRVIRIVVRQSALYVFQPDFFRYIDNANGFGHKFELTHQPEGWTLTRQ